MYEFIKGQISDISPSFVVIETHQIGYFVSISINTYEKIKEQKEVKLYIHEVVKEDSYDFFGFADKSERHIFRQLITVSGIGANTARLMLSSLSPEKIVEAIATEDVKTLKNIKGIGIKTAQRIIVDLKDKISNAKLSDTVPSIEQGSVVKEEAVSALIMLGFNKKNTEEVVDKIIRATPGLSIEQLVKNAIKQMSN